ncbi:family 78 glycoside hydrolase catalytic domain [Asticcacaulis sp. 201]|uniref:family 78 glycoside hydrolase catalytic domain n=1 Tax=Asticcacaulis sp. 201 TaxID=3028787 RepID=UPI002915DCE9|nr:family 78 glycoside hydrolase catalytic domain [Asticcacaulis sp. 201]MDV6330369.1 family 78 glycoside hydrolase catalytic domain [Asticcacaulis sp. 201]
MPPIGPRLNRRHFLAATSVAAAVPANTALARKPTTRFAVTDLRAEQTVELLGTQERAPRLSWRLTGADRGLMQTHYRLRAASTPDTARADLWDSGLIASDACFDISYAGKALAAMQRVWWSVEVTDNRGRIAWSAATWFETGLLTLDDWKARWIVAEDGLAEGDRAAALKWIWSQTALDDRVHAFRLDFDAPTSLVSADVLIAGKDWIRGVWANGETLPVPDQPVPNWGTLVPVPAHLKPGRNSVCVLVQAETTGFFPVDGGAFAALIRLRLSDGTIKRLVSDSRWKVRPVPPEDWTAATFDAAGWANAQKSGSDAQNDPRPAEPAMQLRTAFTPKGQVVNARLYATALGAYEARLNGQPVSPARLAPEISVARDHIFYQTYDVTRLIRSGENAFGVLVGDGWYASAFGWRLERYGFGPAPRRLLAQLRLDYADGTSEWIVTDDTWRIGQSAIVSSEIYNGEVFNARQQTPGWDLSSFGATRWPRVRLGDAPKTRILAQTSPHLVPIGTRRAARITQPKPSVYVFDFGQNFAGWARLRARGQAGQTITLKFAEYLKADGEVDQANLRMAKCQDHYTLRGDAGGETYEPHFTYHGFRYVQVENYPGTPKAADIEGIVVSSACRDTGRMTFDSALVQQFWNNAVWSQRSNFFAVPTDCPQRDERMGWMGDIQVFLDAAAFNMEVDPFIRRFLIEARAAQTLEGAYPIVVPQPESFPKVTTAGWSEAGVILPWTLWKRYGDTAVIAENWDAMTAWMTYLLTRNPDHVWRKDRGLDLGDWLSVDAVKPDDETTPRILCATAYWAYCADLMTDMAHAIGRDDLAGQYRDLRGQIGQAFAREFIDAQGKCGNGSQTSQVLSLYFKLVPTDRIAGAAQVLADDIRRRGMKLSTGFLGTPYLLDVLADTGHFDAVSGLLLQTEKPSWGYMPLKGATTMWERWDGDTGDLAMNSYNHYAYGAVCGFMYRRLAGLSPAAPGFRRLHAEPVYLPKAGSVGATYDSCLGRFAGKCEGDAGGLTRYDLTVPPNAVAEVILPDGPWREGNTPVDRHTDIRGVTRAAGQVRFEVGSGQYVFRR